eukprot:GFYU01032980.1.p1 GENE.GFYU01032980.1~~GFYU01032980.1.p1  ORF type:complete len:519 (+),score=82.26 GFYU01032980.1:241-1797(+)
MRVSTRARATVLSSVRRLSSIATDQTAAPVVSRHSNELRTELPRSAYVHLPFCRRRCHYCDFATVVVPKAVQEREMSAYTESLIKEIGSSAEIYNEYLSTSGTPTRVSDSSLQTIYFGGGTPTLLPLDQLENVVGVVQDTYGTSDAMEMSIEMDPGTFNEDSVRRYIEMGFNRFSVGMQTVHDHLLLNCGRAHDSVDTMESISMLNSAMDAYSDRGIVWSVDLIIGLPEQTMDHWVHTLDTVLSSVRPHHISVYDLELAPRTRFGRRYSYGQLPLPPNDVTGDMYKYAQSTLAAHQYTQYEVSSYVRDDSTTPFTPTSTSTQTQHTSSTDTTLDVKSTDNRCKHHLAYWRYQPFYGFGLGATSFAFNRRVARPRRMSEYHSWVDTLSDNVESCARASESDVDVSLVGPEEDVGDRFLNLMMVGLRSAEGVNCERLESEFGRPTLDQVESFVANLQRDYINSVDSSDTPSDTLTDDDHLVKVIALSSGDRAIRLTPTGLSMSNQILGRLFDYVKLPSSQ